MAHAAYAEPSRDLDSIDIEREAAITLTQMANSNLSGATLQTEGNHGDHIHHSDHVHHADHIHPDHAHPGAPAPSPASSSTTLGARTPPILHAQPIVFVQRVERDRYPDGVLDTKKLLPYVCLLSMATAIASALLIWGTLRPVAS